MLCIERLQFFISSQKLSAPAYCKIPEADEALQSPVVFVICWQIFPRCQETIRARRGSTSHYAQPVLQKPCASG